MESNRANNSWKPFLPGSCLLVSKVDRQLHATKVQQMNSDSYVRAILSIMCLAAQPFCTQDPGMYTLIYNMVDAGISTAWQILKLDDSTSWGHNVTSWKQVVGLYKLRVANDEFVPFKIFLQILLYTVN